MQLVKLTDFGFEFDEAIQVADLLSSLIAQYAYESIVVSIIELPKNRTTCSHVATIFVG